MTVEFDKVRDVSFPKSGGHTGSNSPDNIKTDTLLTTGLNASLLALCGCQASQSSPSKSIANEEKSGYAISNDSFVSLGVFGLDS